jgi:hypothetical protein
LWEEPVTKGKLLLGKSKLREERQGAGNARGEKTKRQGGRVRKRAS